MSLNTPDLNRKNSKEQTLEKDKEVLSYLQKIGRNFGLRLFAVLTLSQSVGCTNAIDKNPLVAMNFHKLTAEMQQKTTWEFDDILALDMLPPFSPEEELLAREDAKRMVTEISASINDLFKNQVTPSEEDEVTAWKKIEKTLHADAAPNPILILGNNIAFVHTDRLKEALRPLSAYYAMTFTFDGSRNGVLQNRLLSFSYWEAQQKSNSEISPRLLSYLSATKLDTIIADMYAPDTSKKVEVIILSETEKLERNKKPQNAKIEHGFVPFLSNRMYLNSENQAVALRRRIYQGRTEEAESENVAMHEMVHLLANTGSVKKAYSRQWYTLLPNANRAIPIDTISLKIIEESLAVILSLGVICTDFALQEQQTALTLSLSYLQSKDTNAAYQASIIFFSILSKKLSLQPNSFADAGTLLPILNSVGGEKLNKAIQEAVYESTIELSRAHKDVIQKLHS